jgi:outer membrane protein TolC
MKKITSLMSFLILITCTGVSFGQSAAKPLSLQECIKYTAEKNTAIVTAKIQEEIAQKKVNEVIGSGLPQINLNGSLTNNLELPVQIIPGEFLGGAPGSEFKLKFGTKYSTALTGQVNQMIFNGSFWVGLDAAKRSNEYYRRGTEAATDNALYDVSVAFYRTLIVEKQIKLLEFNLVSLGRTLEDTKLLRDNGKAKDIDVDRLQVGYNNLQHQIQNATEQLKQAYNGLKFQMGMPVSELLSIQDTSLDNPLQAVQQPASQDSSAFGRIGSYDDRSDFRQLSTARELQELNRKNEISKYLPSLNAFGSYTWAIQKNDFTFPSSDWYKYYSIGLQLSVPIFTGGQTYARIQQAELNVKQLDEQMHEAGRGIDMEVANAHISFNNAKTNIETEIQNLDLAKKVYTLTEVEYKEGVTNAATLVDSETKYREAQTNYINSLLNLYIARIELEKAKGSISSYLGSISRIK